MTITAPRNYWLVITALGFALFLFTPIPLAHTVACIVLYGLGIRTATTL